MIERIDIENFGSFKDFSWTAEIKNEKGNVVEFKKLNILYGRNYSGKTTLSRLVRCLETGETPPRYSNPKFTIKADSNTISETNIDSHNLEVRVFNRDFVDDHLSFLRDDKGEIEPFAVIGGDNTKIEKEISQKRMILGNSEPLSGLLGDQDKAMKSWQRKRNARDKAADEREKKLNHKANQDIKQKSHIYGDVNYNIRKITSDIETLTSKNIQPLAIDQEERLRELIKQESIPEIELPEKIVVNLPDLRGRAYELLQRKIKPSQPIQELLDDSLLQAWAKSGIEHHQDKRTTCGFCGSPLPEGLWDKLDKHFSEESEKLDIDLADIIVFLKDELEKADEFIDLNEKSFLPNFRDDFNDIHSDFQRHIKDYKAEIKALIKELQNRKSDPFKSRTPPAGNDASVYLINTYERLQMFVAQHEKKSQSLSQDQVNAKKSLRLNEILRFTKEIDLESIDKNISDLESQVKEKHAEFREIDARVKRIQSDIEVLQKQLKDERRGAEKINELLTHFFGHESLRLEAIEDWLESGDKAVKFEIRRGDQIAYNLSDGECSLISFCYFMAKLGDAETAGKNLTIYIDDPVSSLDSNHVFFVYSLIESLIARPSLNGNQEKVYRYNQLFISTHNLEFLKFLKRLSKPKKQHEQFMMIRKKQGSILQLMPHYLRNYITEFHFLFDEIYKCLDSTNASSDHHSFYNFGNNLRKFLEAFLFFKFPFSKDESDLNQRLDKYFQSDGTSRELINRLINEYSHLGVAIDRGVQPVDCDEISKVATNVLKRMKKDDPEQFSDLLSAINRPDPFVDQ